MPGDFNFDVHLMPVNRDGFVIFNYVRNNLGKDINTQIVNKILTVMEDDLNGQSGGRRQRHLAGVTRTELDRQSMRQPDAASFVTSRLSQPSLRCEGGVTGQVCGILRRAELSTKIKFK